MWFERFILETSLYNDCIPVCLVVLEAEITFSVDACSQKRVYLYTMHENLYKEGSMLPWSQLRSLSH